MTRGRRPVRALEQAIPIAERRGIAMEFRHRAGGVCDLLIICPGFVVFVRIRRVNRLLMTPEGIRHDCADEIAALRTIASSPGIVRELWIHSPKGSRRFFRIGDETITEIGPEGMPIDPSGAGNARRFAMMENG